MDSTFILRLALPTPLRRLFDYLPPQGIDPKALIPGIRIRVPFQSRELVGILTAVVTESSVPYGKLKTALEILDEQPIFTSDVYALCQWAADYYHASLGEVFSAALPKALRQGKPAVVKKRAASEEVACEAALHLNDAQQQAVAVIDAARHRFQTFLLDGVTGSGKTEVYLQTIATVLHDDQQALVLVPEISLTPQTIARFRARFSVPVVSLHSNLSEGERLHAWLSAKSGQAKIVIGTRSAVFTPFARLRLIIVDEEHDASFKQHDRFRYHARDLAVMRANLLHIPIVLGSATPSLESLLNVKRDRYQRLSLPNRAGKAVLPQYQFINLHQEVIDEGLSESLVQAMRTTLENKHQVLLFLNRRGFAPALYCTQCAWTADCRRCDARLVYHRSPPRLHCHHCDGQVSLPTRCAKCGETRLKPLGLGTQRIEQALVQHFPNVPLIRVDRDSTQQKGAMQTLLDQIHSEERAILLGTQMLAKGHHFPRVMLVGIVDADGGLFSTDFRAAEHMGQLLLQVAGRAGRVDQAGTVLIQTHHPEHPLLQTLIQHGYAAFAQTLLEERKQTRLPPFSHFAVFRAESRIEKHATQFLAAIKEIKMQNEVKLFGPVSALMAKRKGLHCQQLFVRAHERRALQTFLKIILASIEQLSLSTSVKWILDVDPVEG